jgi:hypothetical protein
MCISALEREAFFNHLLSWTEGGAVPELVPEPLSFPRAAESNSDREESPEGIFLSQISKKIKLKIKPPSGRCGFQGFAVVRKPEIQEIWVRMPRAPIILIFMVAFRI